MTNSPLVVLAAPVLERGYGVATVALAQERLLREAGFRVQMISMRAGDGASPDLLRAPPMPFGFSEICRSMGAGLAIVHGPPFLTTVATVGLDIVHWEHGLVFPEFLREPYATRARRELSTRVSQCRKAGLVVCPSRTLADRLELPLARVIPNGADHLPLPVVSRNPAERILLAVLRTGPVEDQYKGLPDLLELPSRLGPRHPWTLRVVLTGPGDADRALREAGWTVFRSTSREELGRHFAESSAYLAPSRCESFDLPLVEAQRAGAAGLAYHGSAHPETCPHLYGSVEEAAQILGRWDRGGLEAAREASLHHAAPFTWENHGRALVSLVRERLTIPVTLTPVLRARTVFWRLWWAAGSAAYDLGRKCLR